MVPVAVPDEVDDGEVVALRERVRATLRIDDPWLEDAGKGIGPDALAGLLQHWGDGYDWRLHERRIRSLPWRIAGTGDTAIRVVDRPVADPGAPVVVLLHGWPDSVLRFERLLPLLDDVHLIVPAMPGFPYALGHRGAASANDVAERITAALTDLGHQRFILSGGDVGGDVAEIIAGTHPERVSALHLTNVSPRHARAVDPEGLAPEVRTYLASTGAWFRTDGGYIAAQSSRPRTLISGLGDSPAGLAAWILEKVTAWSDDPAAAFSRDELLTWVSAYWFTKSIGTSFSTYVQPATIPERTRVPTVVSAFPADLKPAPRSYIEMFVDLREYRTHEAGGHFAAWEQPEAYATDLRHAVRIGMA